LAAAGAGPAAGAAAVAEGGRGDGIGELACDDAAGGRGADDAGTVPGSGVMMLTGGVEAAVGNSALVGLPVGIVGASPASGAAGAGAVVAGAFHDGE
jgi:hypothetical protein